MTRVPFSFAQPYRSQRSPVLARRAVATSHPLAAQVGLNVLEQGGNAIDAAIASAAALTVVEPTMNGVGGDLFAMVWDGQGLHGLNASGAAPRAWSLARFAGCKRMPELGWESVTVPGAVSGWVALHERFGSKPFAQLLGPAAAYARGGFPVMPKIADLWAQAAERFREFPEFCRVFLPEGRAPRAGEWVTLPDLGDTLSALAETRGAALYGGALGERLARAAQLAGAAMTLDDLAEHRAEWVEPIGVDFGDVRLLELPPNGQGLAALLALGILQHLPLTGMDPDSAPAVHLQIEAMKLALSDCHRHVADPRRMRISVEELLAPSRLAGLAEHVDAGRSTPLGGYPDADHGTVYVTTADAEGRMVSLIQSNYLGFGSGIVVPRTGISLQNRGLGFSLDPGHPNVVQGGARPYHTIMPGFLLRAGSAAMSFGVMGGHMQPQGHVQLVLRTVLFGQNPQAACDAPRWYVGEDGRVALEPELSTSIGSKLSALGHQLLPDPAPTLFGGAQAIYRLDDGYLAASDPRKDGQAVGS
jgi:gamma-glutamyltranspeptidase/glutathione hydrolase